MAAQPQQPIIIVKRKKKGGAAHHGGAWKVAYADFVTAMMAFFMVMWLVTSTPEEKLGGIADYFKNPSAVQGQTSTLVPGRMGPGGAGDAPIRMFDAVTNPPGAGPKPNQLGVENDHAADKAKERERERRKMEELKKLLEEAIAKSLAMAPFKDQLLIDLTPEGLRVQIVDAQNRPMFDLGSPELKGYTREILVELGGFFNQVDNRMAISGHTDITPYTNASGVMSNWELSTQRANAARRALVMGGLEEDKLARIVGLSSSVLFDKTDPRNPINRRISIVLLNQDAERAAEASERPRMPGDGRAADPAPIPTAQQLREQLDPPRRVTAKSQQAPELG
ncbi:MAG: Flagellar motor rotation protein MotB [uncultured Lysobacter sp.]|uniref:Flagellar motor rotation protein MotB n=1 Tax=uncultured Lysobacter sp. TaxID=271060 RepID=A0A6J4L9Q8_9GAMM|nr:MAG: Flagellar motor rotation protein MotB [uncultured Lysobacter sp.]